MLRKFISNAVLSVAFDKKARKKIKALNKKKKPLYGQDGETNSFSRSVGSFKSTASFIAEDSGSELNAPKPPFREPVDASETLIEKIAASSKETIEHKPNSIFDKKPIAQERAVLIEKAMAIRRSKLHVLDQLNKEQLNKLTSMAIQALNVKIEK